MNRIASFSVDHDYIVPGIYVSRIDGDITTYDLRTRHPNCGDLMDHATMHTAEHMLATFLRNSRIGGSIIYFGPMGCQTGFYLLVRSACHAEVIGVLRECLQNVADYKGDVFGASRKECGNYASLDLAKARQECQRYRDVIQNWTEDKLAYPQG